MTDKKSQLSEPLIDKEPTNICPVVVKDPSSDIQNDNQAMQFSDFESEEYQDKIIQKNAAQFIFIEDRKRLIVFQGYKYREEKFIFEYSLPDYKLISQKHLSDSTDQKFRKPKLISSDYFWFSMRLSRKTDECKLSIAHTDQYFQNQTSYSISYKKGIKFLKIDFPNYIFYHDHETKLFIKRQIVLDTLMDQQNNKQRVINIVDLSIISKITSKDRTESMCLFSLQTLSCNQELIIDKSKQNSLMLIDFKTDTFKEYKFAKDEEVIKMLDQDKLLFIGQQKLIFYKITYFFVDSKLYGELDDKRGYLEVTKSKEVNFQYNIKGSKSEAFESSYLNGNLFYYFSRNLFYIYDLTNQVQVLEQAIPSHPKNRVIKVDNKELILYMKGQTELHSSLIKRQQQIIMPTFVDYDYTNDRDVYSYISVGKYSYFSFDRSKQIINFINTQTRKSYQKRFASQNVKSLSCIDELELIIIFDQTSIFLMKLEDKNDECFEILKVTCNDEQYYLRGCELFLMVPGQKQFLKIQIRSATDFEVICLNSQITASSMKYLDEESMFIAFWENKNKTYLLNLNGEVLRQLNFEITGKDVIDIQEDHLTFINKESYKLQQINLLSNEIVNELKFQNEYIQGERYNNLLIIFINNGEQILLLNRENIRIVAQLNVNYSCYPDLDQYDRYLKIRKIHGQEQKLYFYSEQYFKEVYEINLELLKIIEKQIPTSKYYEHDHNKQSYTFYSNSQDKQQICYLDSKLNLGNDYELLVQTYSKDDNQLIKYIKENDLQKLLINPLPNAQTFLHHIALRPRVIEEFVKKLQFVDKETLPLLLAFNRDNESPLDLAIKNNQTKSIVLFFDMMIRFQEHFAFNYLFDKQICTLLEKGFNLQEYILSKFPVIQIQETFYPSLHKNDTNKIYICNKDNPFDILTEETYNEIIGQDLMQQDQDTQNDNVTAIDYFLINLPSTIQDRQLSQLLNNTDQIELFDTICVQTIINFKWNTYTFNFFFKQFIVFICFIVVFLIDFYYSIWNKDNQEFDYIPVIFKAIGISILSYFMVYEIRSAIKQTFAVYIQDMWNSFDFLLISVYIAFAIVDTLDLSLSTKNILISSILLLAFVKLNFFLRIFDGFSFMVSMMQGVFLDLKYFMAFFLLTVLEFGFLFTVLVQNSETYDDSIGSMGFFIMAFRTSLGDFDLDNYGTTIETDGSFSLSIIILRWIIWIIGVFVMNIVFMNFIIAVISQSYEKVMQKLIAQSYKVKIDMIAERELHFNEDDFQNQQLFPKYLILRKPAEDAEYSGQEWQGFVKDIKLYIAKNTLKSKFEIKSDISVLQKQITTKFADNYNILSGNLNQIDGRLNKIEQNLEAVEVVKKEQTILSSRVQSLQDCQNAMDGKVQSIQDQLNQLIQHLIPKQE